MIEVAVAALQATLEETVEAEVAPVRAVAAA